MDKSSKKLSESELLSVLKERMSYNPLTGVFTRINRATKLGCISRGRMIIEVNDKPYPAANLAWLFSTGRLPNSILVHVNGNPLDNSIANLKEHLFKVTINNDSDLLAFLSQYLSYNPLDGHFYRIKRNCAGCRKEIKVGWMAKDGYCKIEFQHKTYATHRLAWLFTYGYLPKECIDHINGNRADNRICNLREATRVENSQNQRKAKSQNKSGYLGVSLLNNKYHASITVNKVFRHIGIFDTAIEAHEAYLKVKRKEHIFCTI